MMLLMNRSTNPLPRRIPPRGDHWPSGIVAGWMDGAMAF